MILLFYTKALCLFSIVGVLVLIRPAVIRNL